MAKAQITLEIEIPHLPNFLRLTGQEGGVSLDLGQLNDNSYNEFEKEYIKALRKHWEKRRIKLNQQEINQ